MSRKKGTLCRGEVSRDGVDFVASVSAVLAAAAVLVRELEGGIVAQWVDFGAEDRARAAATLLDTGTKTRETATDLYRPERGAHTGTRYGDIPIRVHVCVYSGKMSQEVSGKPGLGSSYISHPPGDRGTGRIFTFMI